jgi:hypothetical protein
MDEEAKRDRYDEQDCCRGEDVLGNARGATSGNVDTVSHQCLRQI